MTKKTLLCLVPLLVLSCTTQPNQTLKKTEEKPASTQATSAPSKTPRALAQVSIGETEKTLDRLAEKLPWMITTEQLRYSLEREFKDAADEIDLTQGTEAVLGYSEDLLGFVNFSFALKRESKIKEKLKTPPGLDTKGHQFALRPLPGSLLSPFNRELYIDIKDDRLWVSDQPEGLQRIPLHNGLVTPTLRASLDFASLWYIFGVPYQDAFITEKKTALLKATTKAPEPKQDDVVFESLFMLADSLHQIQLEAETAEGVLLNVNISTKQKIDTKLPALEGELYQIVPNSQFGFRAQVPDVVLRTIADARRKLAPPAMDSLAMYYPIGGAASGAAFFGGGIDANGFWSVGQYAIKDAALARLGLEKHFSETPKKDAQKIEPGRSFTFQAAKAKSAANEYIDTVSSKLENPTTSEKALHIDNIQTRYQIMPKQVVTATGESGATNAALLQKDLPKLPAALIALLEKKSSAQPASQPTTTPLAFAWFSPAGVQNLDASPASIAATLALQGEQLLLRVAFLP